MRKAKMHFYNVSIIDSFQCTMFESFEQKNGFCIVVVVVAIFLYQSASAQYPTIFSFFFFSRLYYFLFFLLVEHRVGKFHKSFCWPLSFTDGSSIECIKGVVVAWAWHPYNRLSPAQWICFFVDNLSKQRFDEILGFFRNSPNLGHEICLLCCQSQSDVADLDVGDVVQIAVAAVVAGLALEPEKD